MFAFTKQRKGKVRKVNKVYVKQRQTFSKSSFSNMIYFVWCVNLASRPYSRRKVRPTIGCCRLMLKKEIF